MDEIEIDYKIKIPLLETTLELENLKMQVAESKRPQLFGVGKGGTVCSTPIFYKDQILIGSCDGFLHCLDLNGKEKWKFSTGDVVNTGAVAGDKYYFPSFDSYFYCVDMKGNLVWKIKTDSPLSGWPEYYNGAFHIGSKNGVLYSISTEGRILWKFETREPIGTNVEIDESGIYFGCYDNKLYCLTHSGKLKWTFNGKSAVASPSVYKNIIYCADFDNNFYAISKNGELLWKFNIEASIGGQMPRIPIVDGIAYFGNWNGDVFALDLEKRKLLWKFKTGEMIVGKPVVVDEVVYVGSTDSNFYALDAKTGGLIWKYNAGSYVAATCGFYRGRLYFGTWYGKVICLSKEGKLEWDFQTSTRPPSTVNVERRLELKRIIQESEIVPETFKINYSSNRKEEFVQVYGSFSASYSTKSEDYVGRKINLSGEKRKTYR